MSRILVATGCVLSYDEVGVRRPAWGAGRRVPEMRRRQVEGPSPAMLAAILPDKASPYEPSQDHRRQDDTYADGTAQPGLALRRELEVRQVRVEPGRQLQRRRVEP